MNTDKKFSWDKGRGFQDLSPNSPGIPSAANWISRVPLSAAEVFWHTWPVALIYR